jgi:hypothetical protein
MGGMLCFGGGKNGTHGITPVSRMEFMMIGPAAVGIVAEERERTFQSESMVHKQRLSQYTQLCILDEIQGRHMRVLHHETKGVCAVPLEVQGFLGDIDDTDEEHSDAEYEVVSGDDDDSDDSGDADDNSNSDGIQHGINIDT